MVSSRASLDKSPNENWVEKSGGLPPKVRARARALKKKNPQWTLSHAIAVAISQYKKEGNAAVIAQWEKLKLKNKARMAKKGVKKLTEIAHIELVAAEMLREEAIELAAPRAPRVFDETKHIRSPLDGKFGEKFTASQLLAARRVIEAGIVGLGVGETYRLPGNVGWVQRNASGFVVQGPAGIREVTRNASDAVMLASKILAGKIAEVGEVKK